MDQPLELKFHPHTISHLGVSLYSTLPPVIAELVANAWDANAKKVTIDLQNSNGRKSIVVSDDGDGMSLSELGENFLVIGRNRRKLQQQESRRKPIGKKGIGKLSVFGISEHIRIETIQDHKKNIIELNYKEIIKSETGIYKPKIIATNEQTTENNGTRIFLDKLTRKTDFANAKYATELAYSLSVRFNIFEEMEISVLLNGEIQETVSFELRMAHLNTEFQWEFPIESAKLKYSHMKKITGTIYSTKRPAPANINGIILLSRGKLVNQKTFFGIQSADYAYKYLTGWLNIDFIEDFSDDIISTNRESLNWDEENALELKDYLVQVLNEIKNDWRVKRRKEKEVIAVHDTNIQYEKWMSTVPEKERQVLFSLINKVMDEPEIDEENAKGIVNDLHTLIPEYPEYHWRHLHNQIHDSSEDDYKKKDYLRAAIEATKQYEEIVSGMMGAGSNYGDTLMDRAFGSSGALKVLVDLTQTIENLQSGQHYLSKGLISGFRNPAAHEKKQDLQPDIFSDKDCLDILSLISYLITKLENGKLFKRNT